MAEDVAVTDSGLTTEAAPSEVAGAPSDATHGDESEQAATPTDDTSAEGEVSESEGDDDGEEQLPESATEEEKTESQKRRERRQAKEAERIERAVAERFEAAERAREAKAAQEAAEATQRQAAEEYEREFSDFIGSPEARKALSDEIAALTRELVTMRPYEDGTDYEALEQKQTALNEKIAKRDEWDVNKEKLERVDSYWFAKIQDIYAKRATSLPTEHARLYLQATDPDTALTRLEAGIVAREAAKHAADKAAAVKTVTAELEKERAAHAATRTGGPGSGPVPATGGNGGSSNGRSLTPERYAAMDSSERAKLRSTVEGRAQIDAMMQRRSGAA